MMRIDERDAHATNFDALMQRQNHHVRTRAKGVAHQSRRDLRAVDRAGAPLSAEARVVVRVEMRQEEEGRILRWPR